MKKNNTLLEIFKNLDRRGDKFLHYFPLYEKWFSPYIGKAPRILEIGVQNGGSSEMWLKYFGAGTSIIGVDIDESCLRHERDGIKIIIGDQGNHNFWKSFNFKDFDIIIDDGSHENPDQIQTLKSTYRLLKAGGLYWCEDCHTSYYLSRKDGGYLNSKSFIEYTKTIVDVLNSDHTKNTIGKKHIEGPGVDLSLLEIYDQIQGIHFYDSIVLIEKGPKFNFQRIIKNDYNIL